MKATAELALGCEVKKAVVTVPAYFNDAQRRLTKVREIRDRRCEIRERGGGVRDRGDATRINKEQSGAEKVEIRIREGEHPCVSIPKPRQNPRRTLKTKPPPKTYHVVRFL